MNLSLCRARHRLLLRPPWRGTPSKPTTSAIARPAAMSERTAILTRIRVLRAKTVANGCTKDEATAARAKARAMMAAHEVSDAELAEDLSASPTSTRTRKPTMPPAPKRRQNAAKG